MAEESDDDKSEEPTEKRLADAVERGSVPMSREVPFLTSLIAYLGIEIYVLPSATPPLVADLTRFLDDPAGWRFETGGDASAMLTAVALIVARFVGPAALLMTTLGLAGSLLQAPPRIVPQRIAPDLARISPLAGLARIFGPRGWTEFAKAALKLVAVAGVAALVVASQRYALFDAIFVGFEALPGRMVSLCLSATSAVALAALVIAGADLTWSRTLWRRDQRMSRHEVKEEVRQAEGDRMLKARLRSLRLDRSRRNMLNSVARATMVVVNPTHYAVAMRYVRSEGGAPLVLAKGVDLIALKIRDIAFENGIPVIEDRPLARSLYEAVAVDAAVPPEFYRAVAEIVHLLQTKRAAWPLSRRRLN